MSSPAMAISSCSSRPSMPRTLILWLSPFILLLAGLFFLATRRRAALADEPLTEDESRRVEDLLGRE